MRREVTSCESIVVVAAAAAVCLFVSCRSRRCEGYLRNRVAIVVGNVLAVRVSICLGYMLYACI